MSKSKAVKKSAKKTSTTTPLTNASNPTYTVSRPDVPAMYGLKGTRHLPFSHAETRLANSRNYWICTARPDGRPHSIPVWGFFLDGVLYFGTARTSRKARNLAHNPALSVHLESGDDAIILEGTAVEVDLTDQSTLKKLDAASRAKYNMPLMVVPEGVFYAVRPHTILAWTEKDFPNNATRWKFNNSKAQ